MNYNLANAAPFNNNSNNNNESANSNSKNTNTAVVPPKRNVTFKNRHESVKPKIKKETIDCLDVYQSEEETNDFMPKDKGNNELELEQEQENVVQFNYKEQYDNNSKSNTDLPSSKGNYNKIDSTYASDYYKQFSPYQGSYQIPQQSVNSNFELLKKLDNILHLLEEQQEEKTNLITEELILYVFLGVFVIYVLDSFVKVGKYTR